ncbi:LPXTG cell wall anchor domain-containing protein [Arthrobacter sp. CJ23]|uniref:LPXTG cell wall anchor domain-containing protein n=1 Tax=Arthrobacter sp. CJ23 TaxID=2972479 RepID=UPI00215CC594|nr:LPXTG cell wall anchor domain-containing protein [Arthrobacter sp. CJ23]UVJ38744.1 LPXTG cell wall anchor domain-containing protein [Arthrobacter sp. CJ23]
MKKSIAALALAGTIALAGSAPALAVDYPATAEGTVSSATTPAGTSVTFSGTGFTPGETINVTVTLTGGPQAAGAGTGSVVRAVGGVIPLAPIAPSAVANSAGAWSTTVTFDAPGTYLLTAVGATSGRSVTATVVVTAGAGLANTGGGTPLANTGAGLANTGADSSLILWGLAGAGALAAGSVSVVMVRRRAKAGA